MKYILASSSDIDNIISCESISPYSFYKERKFGYDFYESKNLIEELSNIENIIVLFSEIPSFDLRKSNDTRAYPMVIEVDESKLGINMDKVGNYKDVDVYTYDKTITLSPLNCQFLLFNENAKKQARLDVDGSAMAKMGTYFKITTIKDKSKLSLSEIIKKINLNDTGKNQSKENDYDKLKGFVYGYCIGKALSLSKDYAYMRMCQKRIYDLRVAVDKGASISLYEDKIKEIDEKYREHHPATILHREFEEDFKDCKEKIISKCGEGPYSEMLKGYLGIKGYKEPEIYCIGNIRDYESSVTSEMTKFIEAYKREKIKEIKVVGNLSKTDNKVEISSVNSNDCNLTNSISLYKKILDKILWENNLLSFGKLKSQRYEVAESIVKNIKEVYSDKWSESKEQEYLNSLLDSINGDIKSFNVNDMDEIVLKSIAVFILNGDDLEELIKRLENEAIPSYEYTLALWGAINGYICIPRKFLSGVFSKTEDFERIYKECYKLVNDKDLKGELVPDTYDRYATNISNGANNINLPIKGDNYGKSDNGENDLKTLLLKFDDELLSSNDKKNKDLFCKLISEFSPEGNWNDFIFELNKKGFTIRSKENIKKFLKEKGIDVKESKSEPKTSNSASTNVASPKNIQAKLTFSDCRLVDDKSWIEETKNLIDKDEAKKQYEKDCGWFLNENKYICKYDDNEFIERFEVYLTKKKNPKDEVNYSYKEKLKETYKDIPIEKIINYLKKKYNV